MATITYIPEKTQSKTAMGKVIRYCARKDKTACEVDSRKFQLISGKDCCGETAYREFIATKQQYKKANGMFFYQYVQSFSPEENITPQMAHEIGCKFAEYFKGHEVLIATHTDAAHIHTHFIINSVNFENGKKLQMPRGSIYKLRDFSDELCRQYDLSIVPPKKTKAKNLNTREYRAALKGESWKWELINVVDNAMKHSQSKAEFIASMKKLGYGIKWQDNLKHITYTTPDGKKCRDNKIHDDKYLKSNMEVYYEHRAIKGTQQAGKSDREISTGNTDVCDTAGNLDTATANVIFHNTGTSANAGASITSSEMEGDKRRTQPDFRANGLAARRSSGAKRKDTEMGNTQSKGQHDNISPEGSCRSTESNGTEACETRHIAPKVTPKVDGLGSVSGTDILRLAKDIEDMVNPRQEQEKKQKQTPKRKLKKKQDKYHDWDMEL